MPKPGEMITFEDNVPAHPMLEDRVYWDITVNLQGSYLLDEWVSDERGEVFYVMDVADLTTDEAPVYAVLGEDWPDEE